MGRRHKSSSSSNSGSIGIIFIFLIISGAVAIFPYVLLFLGVLALLFLLVLLVRFLLRKSNQPRTLQHIHAPGNTDFAYRLQRARTSDLRIVRYLSDDRSAAEIHNPESGNTYSVTFTSCTCADFEKRNAPVHFFFGLLKRPQKKLHLCKHIMFLMLSTGQYASLCLEVCGSGKPDGSFIPNYRNYYSGQPTGPGFCNFYPCDFNRFSPSVGQLNYLHAVHIPYPALCCEPDVRALLTRYQEDDDERTPPQLFRFCSEVGICVSLFASPQQIWDNIFDRTNSMAHFFCYAVYCRELGVYFGGSSISPSGSAFKSFMPTPQQLDYIRMHPNLIKPHKSSSAYKSAVEHLRSNGLL